MRRRFVQCDVFSSVACRGNGLAVIVDAEGLPEAEMQAIAAWTNLAETTFLFAPRHERADYEVRIFTPVREMPFAGHPTLGSCAAWLATGGSPKQPGIVRQECGVGIVEIDVARPVPAFVAPPTTIEPLAPGTLAAVVEALGLAPDDVVRSARLDNGPVWTALELRSAEAVLAVDSARVRWPAFIGIGLVGPHATGAECDVEVRMLAPSSGMSEDPITGSLNAALAHWMRAEGRLPETLLVAQGTSIGRVGRVHIGKAGDRIMIGGETRIVVEGTIDV